MFVFVLACAHPVETSAPAETVGIVAAEPVDVVEAAGSVEAGGVVEAAAVVEALDSAHVPTTLPDLTLTSLAGEPITLPPGGVVLALWASWCPPCRKELPHLQALYEQGAPIVTVSVDYPNKRANVDAMIELTGLTAPVAHDIRVARTMGTVAIPGIYVYSAEGELLWWQEDAFDPDDPAFLAALAAVTPD